MASSVMEEIHNLLTGHFACAFCITHLWISSPSCPASPQLMMLSAACISFSMVANCFLMPSSLMSLIPNRCGIIGNAERLQCFHIGV
ncbi:Uncharacterised protein [Segatella copri]|nr:Uncharacterised protein [Segatella copri]